MNINIEKISEDGKVLEILTSNEVTFEIRENFKVTGKQFYNWRTARSISGIGKITIEGKGTEGNFKITCNEGDLGMEAEGDNPYRLFYPPSDALLAIYGLADSI